MADGDFPDVYPQEAGGCAACGRLPEQVDAMAGPGAGPLLCADCVDRARAAARPAAGACALCERAFGRGRPGVRVGDSGMAACRPCLDGLAAAMAEPE